MKNSIKKKYWLEIVLYAVYIIIGIILITNPQLEVLGPLVYASSLFYVITFVSTICYFCNRRDGDYELLFLSLSSLIVGTIILFNEYSASPNNVFGTSILCYTLFNVGNKIYHSYKLNKEKEISAYPKVSVGILLTILGVLVVNNLFNEVTMQTLILGYYFVVYGFLCLCEPLMMIILKNKKIESFIIDIFDDEKVIKIDKPKKRVKIKKNSDNKTSAKVRKTSNVKK